MGIRVLHTSDLHGRYNMLEVLLADPEHRFDLWVDTGDFFPNKTRGDRHVEPIYQNKWASEWTRIVPRLAKICMDREVKVLSVSGNHDYVSLSGLLRGAGMPEGTTYDLSAAGRSVSLCGLLFAGFREIPRLNGEWNGERTHGEFKELVDLALAPNPDVLLTHSPPGGILDAVDCEGAHEGIPYLTSCLMNKPHKVRYHLFGHIHEDGGKKTEIGGIMFSNAANVLNGNILELT